MESITVGSIDSHLHSEVQLITAMVELDDGKVKVDLHEIAVGDYAVPLSGHYFQVMVGKPGSARVVARSASLEHVDASYHLMNCTLRVSIKQSTAQLKNLSGLVSRVLSLMAKSLPFWHPSL